MGNPSDLVLNEKNVPLDECVAKLINATPVIVGKRSLVLNTRVNVDKTN